MNAIVRQPVVGGVDGGVGTTTVAAMIDALDAGRIAPDGTEIVDILVARATAASVKAAIFTAAAMPVRPVLVVVAHSSDRWSPPVEQRLKMVEPNLPAVVRMGWISYLAACDNPWSALVEGIYAQYPSKWAEGARRVREQIVSAVTPLVMRPPASRAHLGYVEPLTDAATDPSADPDEPVPRARVS
ncbi:hypothetical protein GS966_27775 [Rhodococcus hoagii]|nr:hypothetical protein [Prescottella equi]NKS10213.1 hypothetical protein [Prescottella equi]NKS35204.1 hypothetical protein [Prescottella equi]NKS35264.1 hypothetical protein [Prescottella equi]NKS62110.1 hypothetical protein [Prescottella equi]